METSEKVFVPFAATHPYEIVRDEIKARGISNKEFALRMGMQASNLSRLLKSNSSITTEIAHKLEDALGIPAREWMSMQLQYDEDVKNIAQRDAKEKTAINIENMLVSIVNMKLLYQRLNINPVLFFHEKLEKLKEYLGIDAQDIPQLNVCFSGNYKKSDKFKEDEREETTWRLLAYVSSRQNRISVAYVHGNADKAANDIVARTHQGEIKEVDIKNILNGYGISYSVVEKIDKTHIDGFSAWIDGRPCIVTTHRYNDMSRLIFTILHELGHIHLHLKTNDSKSYTTTDNTYSSDDIEEIEANRFAENHLISDSLWKKMMSVDSKLETKNIVRTLKMLSKENNLDFGIVSWRYKYESNIYALRGVSPIKIQ